jgi:hypothetical protein
VDLVVFTDPTCFSERGVIRDDLAFAIQARAGGIAWTKAGVAYPQAVFRNVENLGDWWVLPNSYELLYGTLPERAIGTDALVLESAERVLQDWLPKVADQDIADFAEVPDELLPRRDPARLWTESLDAALRRLTHIHEGQPGPVYAAEFYKNVRTLFASDTWDIELARTTFKSGVAFLRWAEPIAPSLAAKA